VLLRADLRELRWRSLEARLERLGPLPEGVERLGGVPVEELASLHRTAACLVFPRLDERFGLPPLEAMASGVRSAR
jgi:glycosyltransferase involved in cell wall biosynthesis